MGEFYIIRKQERESFRERSGEIYVSSVSENHWCNQTSGCQHLIISSLKSSISSATRTHKFSLWPWCYLLPPDQEIAFQQLKVVSWKQGVLCRKQGANMCEQTRSAAARLHQSCPTLCNPTDGSPPGSSVPGILQARILVWVAISFSSAWKWKVKVKLLSCVQLFVTPCTVAHQAPPSMGFSKQEYWSGLPLPFLQTRPNQNLFYSSC